MTNSTKATRQQTLTTVILDQPQLRELDGHLHVDVIETGRQGPQLLAQVLCQPLLLDDKGGVRVCNPKLDTL